MRVGILSFGETSIYHYTSGTLAAQYCREGSHERVSKKVIKELSANCTPSSNPSRHFIPKPIFGVPVDSELLTPLNFYTLDLYYPNPSHWNKGRGILRDPSLDNEDSY